MGLFSKKHREPLIHPEVRRTILVPAPIEDVLGQLAAYSDLHSPKHATSCQLEVGASGEWTVVELPPALHPWTFHNVGFWLLDTPNGGDGTILCSGPGPNFPGHRLCRDPEIGDCLCGVDDDGAGWTVSVPSNEIVRGETVPTAAAPQSVATPPTSRSVVVLLEDPGHDMNPANEATVATRATEHRERRRPFLTPERLAFLELSTE